MGRGFCSHFVPYRDDIRAALEALREQEFRAGRFYQPSEVYPGFFSRRTAHAAFRIRDCYKFTSDLWTVDRLRNSHPIIRPIDIRITGITR